MTRIPLPPKLRSRAVLGLTAAAAAGRFELQVCSECGAVQYPAREMCQQCLGGDLRWQLQSGEGELISETTLRHSNDAYFQQRLPWRLGLVRLRAGPTVIAHLHAGCPAAPSPVRVSARLDKSGQGVLFAFPAGEVLKMADDERIREMTSDPKQRRVLVTDGETAVGHSLVRALSTAGAELIWVGSAVGSKTSPGLCDLQTLPQVACVALDVTNARSVKRLAAQIGGQVDILINTAEIAAPERASLSGVALARAEMDVYYLGLLRLAQEFGPAMRAHAADCPSSTLAWVNLLCIHALSNFPPQGTRCAARAAARSLSQCLRAEMRSSGVRVVNLYPGPIDDESNRAVAPPKLPPEAIAKAVVAALRDGVEDVYPGDLAQELFERWKENPAVLERELGG